MGNSLPFFRTCNKLDPRANLLRQRVRGASRSVRDQPFREAFRNDVLHLLPDEFIAAVSELFLRLNIQQNDLPALVHHHHGIRRRLQQPAVFRIRLCTLAEIAADYGKSAQISRQVARRGVGGSHEKARAVFPHTHALFFIQAAGGGHPKNLLWPAAFDVFGRKESGIVLARDLFKFAACHSLGSGIPTANLALRTQHQYGVVLDAVNEPSIFFFAVSEGLLRKPARGTVALGAPSGTTCDQ